MQIKSKLAAFKLLDSSLTISKYVERCIFERIRNASLPEKKLKFPLNQLYSLLPSISSTICIS
jgi:hypothetical protein